MEPVTSSKEHPLMPIVQTSAKNNIQLIQQHYLNYSSCAGSWGWSNIPFIWWSIQSLSLEWNCHYTYVAKLIKHHQSNNGSIKIILKTLTDRLIKAYFFQIKLNPRLYQAWPFVYTSRIVLNYNPWNRRNQHSNVFTVTLWQKNTNFSI